MAHGEAFARVPPELQPVLEDLIQREPIFHRVAYGRTIEDFKRLMAPEYWETGASGQRYSREFILQTLAQHPPVDAEDAGWASRDFRLRCLGPDTFLLTY